MWPPIVFRADASREIGGGHIIRCLTLADKFEEAGFDVAFVCCSESLAIVPRLDGREILQASGHVDQDVQLMRNRWPLGVGVLIVDHYELDATFERACRGWTKRIVVIDDLADRPHDCDLLVDTTIGRSINDYRQWVHEAALVLVGPEFALLRPEYAAQRKRSSERRLNTMNPDRVMVALGLTDVGGKTIEIVDSLLDCAQVAQIDAVVGNVAPSKLDLQRRAASEPRLKVHVDISHLAEIMAYADLAIGGAGTTSWERCCLGLPSVTLVLADNQREIACQLHEAGAAMMLPDDTPSEKVAEVCISMLSTPAALHQMCRAAMALVDGRGAERVSRTVMALFEDRVSRAGHLHLRPATMSDSQLVWQWRNDPLSQRASRNTDPVPWDQHERWFANVIADDDSIILLGLLRNVPAGIVRFQRLADQEYEVSINLAAEVRGKGVGTLLLAASCDALEHQRSISKIVAEIRIWNEVSLRVFEACQFKHIHQDDEFVTLWRVRGVPKDSRSSRR
jgi:UDP-2,4-diacetamido-2,4,6-trideoxy-beta-L-altropyranose hydrolase